LRVATGVIVQACAGLHHAHELRDADGAPAGLVHRDVSPSNIYVTASGSVKVLDFGVAKVRGGTETEVGTIKGKQQYMAPEQLLGENLDRRCDVFALGIVLFELATHSRLFKRASDYLTARAVLEESIPRADAVDPAVPAPLADVIAKALARKREDRYATAAEFAAAIQAVAPVGSPDEIAAAVNATDELSQMRTRQARVLKEAAADTKRDAADTRLDAAPTVALRSTPKAIDPRPKRAPWVPLVIIGAPLFAAGILTIVVALSPDDKPTREPKVVTTLPGAAVALDAPRAAKVEPDAAPAVEPDAPELEMPVDNLRPPRESKPGRFSIDSTPWATIYIDGQSLGITPILKRSLPAGRHKLKAVAKDGRVKEMSIDIPSGRLAKPIQLTW
jgi:serine/threonine-protein kinase